MSAVPRLIGALLFRAALFVTLYALMETVTEGGPYHQHLRNSIGLGVVWSVFFTLAWDGAARRWMIGRRSGSA